jgi:hypothetical protein
MDLLMLGALFLAAFIVWWLLRAKMWRLRGRG